MLVTIQLHGAFRGAPKGPNRIRGAELSSWFLCMCLDHRSAQINGLQPKIEGIWAFVLGTLEVQVYADF